MLVDDVAALGVVLGLVVGKFVGVFGATWLTARFTRAELGADVSWWDMAGLALLSGIGFTVSLLVAELAFDDQPGQLDNVKTAILFGSLMSAVLAAVVLKVRDRGYRQLDLGSND